MAQVNPTGSFTVGHALRANNATGTIVGDAGGALGSSQPGSGYLTEIGITNVGTPFCINDALINNPTGYHQFCVGANVLGGGLLSYNAYGGAAQLPFNCNINGSLVTSCLGTSPAIIGTASVQNNAALQALSTLTSSSAVIRLGFTKPGDGQAVLYTASTSTCMPADNGSQVTSSNGLCWVANLPFPTPQVWGAVGDGVHDDAPAFRAACAYALRSNSPAIMVPPGTYLFNSLDSSGLYALGLNSGSNDGQACSLIGTSGFEFPVSPPLNGPAVLKLGNGLNRPLLSIKQQGASPHVRFLTIDGNKANQTGWSGGGGGKLFTVQTDDTANPSPETGPIMDWVVLQNGYNGNLYVGAGRFTWLNRVWSVLSGQTSADYSVSLNGYDSVLIQPAIGSNTGWGLLMSEGEQYQIWGGALYLNTTGGVIFGGNMVQYANISQTNIQWNGIGIELNVETIPANTSPGAIVCSSCTFDGNSVDDIKVIGGVGINRQLKLTAPGFLGKSTTGGPNTCPVYNISIPSGSALVEVDTPSFGSGGLCPSTVWSDMPTAVFCTGDECPVLSFLPTFGNGSPTYSVQSGFGIRQGNKVHIGFDVEAAALGSPTGSMTVGNLPWYPYAPGSGVYAPSCAISSYQGWQPPAGYNQLNAVVSTSGGNAVYFQDGGPSKNSIASLVSEWGPISGGTIKIVGSCDYIAVP